MTTAKLKAQRLSNLQINLINHVAAQGRNYVMDLITLGEFRQDTATSLVNRGQPILEARNHGLALSKWGWQVKAAFDETDVTRKKASEDLSSWLSVYFHDDLERREKARQREAAAIERRRGMRKVGNAYKEKSEVA